MFRQTTILFYGHLEIYIMQSETTIELIRVSLGQNFKKIETLIIQIHEDHPFSSRGTKSMH